ncbi:MAG: DUF932 domain-containing protein [Akkermansiaceae bacterium]
MNNVIQLQQPHSNAASTAREIPFEIVENPPELNTNTRPKGLLLHCGAQVVDRADLFEVITPNGSKTHFPIPHRDLLTEVENQLRETGFIIRGGVHALSHEAQRYFGVIQVSLPTRNEQDFNWVVGLRNSHDKSLTSGVVAGTQVLVCDNLCFNGEVKLSRKHTRHIMRDLRTLTARAVGQLGDKFRDLDRRVASYKQHYLPDRSAHDLVIRAVDCGAVTTSQVPSVLQEWRKPQHQEFLPRNGWSLFNAFTEVYKSVNPQTAVKRGQALHGLFDEQVGLAG